MGPDLPGQEGQYKPLARETSDQHVDNGLSGKATGTVGAEVCHRPWHSCEMLRPHDRQVAA